MAHIGSWGRVGCAHQGGVKARIRGLGFRVWGSRKGEALSVCV